MAELPPYPHARRRMLFKRRHDVLDIIDDGNRISVRIHSGPILAAAVFSVEPHSEWAHLEEWHILAEYMHFNWPGIADDLIDCLWAGLLAAGGVEQWTDPLPADSEVPPQFDGQDCAGPGDM